MTLLLKGTRLMLLSKWIWLSNSSLYFYSVMIHSSIHAERSIPFNPPEFLLFDCLSPHPTSPSLLNYQLLIYCTEFLHTNILSSLIAFQRESRDVVAEAYEMRCHGEVVLICYSIRQNIDRVTNLFDRKEVFNAKRVLFVLIVIFHCSGI